MRAICDSAVGGSHALICDALAPPCRIDRAEPGIAGPNENTCRRAAYGVTGKCDAVMNARVATRDTAGVIGLVRPPLSESDHGSSAGCGRCVRIGSAARPLPASRPRQNCPISAGAAGRKLVVRRKLPGVSGGLTRHGSAAAPPRPDDGRSARPSPRHRAAHQPARIAGMAAGFVAGKPARRRSTGLLVPATCRARPSRDPGSGSGSG
jgi:hypothetical protein